MSRRWVDWGTIVRTCRVSYWKDSSERVERVEWLSCRLSGFPVVSTSGGSRLGPGGHTVNLWTVVWTVVIRRRSCSSDLWSTSRGWSAAVCYGLGQLELNVVFRCCPSVRCCCWGRVDTSGCSTGRWVVLNSVPVCVLWCWTSPVGRVSEWSRDKYTGVCWLCDLLSVSVAVSDPGRACLPWTLLFWLNFHDILCLTAV